jgi:hypothetical protein
MFPDEFRYLSPQNLAILMKAIPVLGCLALGAGILMIAGEFDLSIGSVLYLHRGGHGGAGRRRHERLRRRPARHPDRHGDRIAQRARRARCGRSPTPSTPRTGRCSKRPASTSRAGCGFDSAKSAK